MIVEGSVIPSSPILNISYESHVTTPPANLLQHHFTTLHSTCVFVSSYPPKAVPWTESKSYHWLRQAQFLQQIVAMERLLPIKVIPYECARRARI